MGKAFLTGAAGQYGSYLAELLRSKSYEVNGLLRCSNFLNARWIDRLIKKYDWVKLFVDPSVRDFRPVELDVLFGDPSQAKNAVKQSAERKFEGLVQLMVSGELERVKEDAVLS